MPPQVGLSIEVKRMWEPFSAKLKMMAEDFPTIISRALESSTRKLQDDLYALRTENNTIRIEAEKLSCNLTLAEIEHSRVEDAMSTELRVARKEATDLRHKVQLLAQEKIELESKIVPYRVKVADLEALIKTDAAKMKKLEQRSADREVFLGKVEKARDDAMAELAEANKEKGRLLLNWARCKQNPRRLLKTFSKLKKPLKNSKNKLKSWSSRTRS